MGDGYVLAIEQIDLFLWRRFLLEIGIDSCMTEGSAKGAHHKPSIIPICLPTKYFVTANYPTAK